MTFVDSNILIDILSGDPVWKPWSEAQLHQATDRGRAMVNVIVIAELSRGFSLLAGLMSAILPMAIEIEPLDEAAAFDAGRRFVQYLRDRPPQEARQVLPDFFIGAHAALLGIPLLTRDPRLYRRYFPDLSLITPGTHP